MPAPKTNKKPTPVVDSATTQLGYDWWARKSPRLAPERTGNRVTALVDGKETMAAIAKSMEEAKRYIYITDWGLTPWIHLVRDGGFKDKNTLIAILRAAAEKGVQVRVILWDSADKTPGGKIDNKDIEAEKVLEQGVKEGWIIKTYSESSQIRVSRHSPHLFWSHHQKSVVVDGLWAYVGGIDLFSGRWDDPSHPVVSKPEIYLPEIDYYNPCIKNADPKKHPRMPWHDVHVCIEGPSVYDVELSFVQRWNHQHQSGENEDQIRIDDTHKSEVKGKQKVQVVRSVSGTHITTKETEQSIYQAYKNAIRGAKYFIYIENQYFISNWGDDNVKNEIVKLIGDAVIAAIENKRPFKVVIVMPTFPEGQVASFATQEIMHYQYQTIGFKEETVTRERVVYDETGNSYNEKYKVVLREDTPNNKPNGLLNRIVQKLIDTGEEEPWSKVFDYVGIYCLRNGGVLVDEKGKEKAVHEQVYVHTKAMIVDDHIAIVGSANINDRSQLGDRDSELAAVIEDEEVVKNVTFNKKPISVRKFAHDLRKRLWAEHMGLKDGGASVADVFTGFDKLKECAKNNTKIFEEIFPNVPSDRLRTLDDFNNAKPFNEKLTVNQARIKLANEIKGHIVRFPLYWLFEHNLHTVYNDIFANNDTPASQDGGETATG